MEYRQILKKSWEIAWKNKFLWIFGLFIVIFFGGENEYNNVFLNSLYNFGYLSKIEAFLRANFINGQGLFGANLFTSAALASLAVPVMLIFILVTSTLKGSLISCLDKIRRKEATSLGDGLKMGISRLKSVFGLTLISKTATYLLAAIVFFPPIFSLFQSQPSLSRILAYSLILLLLLPISIIISFIARYSSYYAVLNGLGVLPSLKKASELWAKNWLITLEASFILFFINFLITLLLAVTISTITVPFVLLGSISFYSAFSFGFWLILSLGIITATFFLLSVKSAFSVFQFNAWLLIFSELTNKKKGTAVIFNLLSSLSNKLKEGRSIPPVSR